MFRHLFLIACLALNLLTVAFSADTETLKRTIGKVAPAVASAGTIDYKAACATCAQLSQSQGTKATLFSKENNQKIELSVLSEDEANSIFSELAAREDIPFGYPMDGCYARAHKMARILDDKGITAGKAFIEGELYVDTRFGEVGWGYHVAPVVLVKKGGVVAPYIFDPSLFSKPVPYEVWKEKMTKKSKAKVTSEYYTNRFAYDPDDKNSKYTDYQEEQVADMDNTNRNFSRMLFMYNQSKGIK